MKLDPRHDKIGLRALEGVAAFFAAVIVLGQVEALANVDFTEPDWRTELAEHAIALVLAIIAAAIVGRLVMESLATRDWKAPRAGDPGRAGLRLPAITAASEERARSSESLAAPGRLCRTHDP